MKIPLLHTIVVYARGASLLVQQTAKSIKLRYVGVGPMFFMHNPEDIKKQGATLSLIFGNSHRVNGYSFANAKDQDKNSIAISSHTFRLNA